MLWMMAALAGSLPDVQLVEPVVTRAGFPRFADDRFASPAGVDAVWQRMENTDDPVDRRALADWLARLVALHGTEAQRDALVDLALTTPDDGIRVALLERHVRNPRGARLLPLVGHPDPATRATAMRLLHHATPQERVRTILMATSDPAADVRLAAVRAARIHSIDLDIRLLSSDPDPRIRRQVEVISSPPRK